MHSNNTVLFGRRPTYGRIRGLTAIWLTSLGFGAVAFAAPPAFPYLEWTREQRTAVTRDHAYDIAADVLGNIFITGETWGPLSGSTRGLGDAILSRYDAAGNGHWTINIGSNKWDIGLGVAADNEGNAYVAGAVNGTFGTDIDGTAQAFVRKYNDGGGLVWARSFGSTTTDEARDVVYDRLGNVFVAGLTRGNMAAPSAGDYDIFVSKFNAGGDQIWTRQIGSNRFDGVFAAAADGLGNVYATGATTGAFGGPISNINEDVFLVKYDINGNHLWTKQFGDESQQWAQDTVVDSMGNVYLAGITVGSWAGAWAGSYDGFLLKLDSNGNQQWSRQFGGPQYDSANALALDSLGNVYVTGESQSNLPGTDADGTDAFVMKLDPAGQLQWTTQGGPPGPDKAYALASDGLGYLYAAGGVFRGNQVNWEDDDLFVAKIVIPEPSSAFLLMAAGCCLLCGRVSPRPNRVFESLHPLCC